MSHQKSQPPHTGIFDLSVDIKYLVLNYLDNRSLAYLAQTCTYFAMLVRNIFSFREAHVSLVDHYMPKLPPFLNYRAGASVGSTFYMPFINESPFCYTYDMNSHVWATRKLNTVEQIQPQITCAAVIGQKMYLVCGRLLNSYTLSNALIEIDTTDFKAKFIKDTFGVPPRPRHEHSVDAVGDRYLVVFGGLCYNSVGENDVFVYDTFDNRWFVPPITGHLPHLRFGHASTVIGNNLYIHGGAQLDNDSSYIVYDDLYKLDCETWVWYKYEHPEVERYLRYQTPAAGGGIPQRHHLIATNGDSPYDRFQAYMCSYGNKLIIFGGHSIREDDEDNEILCSYPMDELCVFNTKRHQWTVLRAATRHNDMVFGSNAQETLDGEEDDPITVSDMSAATIQIPTGGIRIYIIAGRKAAEVPRTQSRGDKTSFSSKISSSSNSNGSAASVEYHSNNSFLPSIREDRCMDGESEMAEGSNDVVSDGMKSESELSSQGDIRKPNTSQHSQQVKELFKAIDPDMEHVAIDDRERNVHQDTTLLENNNHATPNSKSHSKPGSSSRGNRNQKRRRPSISVIHRAQPDEPAEATQYDKATSSSSSYSSGSDSLGKRNNNPHRAKTVTPCAILLDLIE
ncbi:uncharacterized protein ATC70_010144 [Mucor velutinosus]|uniref:Uncharacterized protein n=1 Tax=Mucor velutinosus TaxID=708070 RepID=A0AAN7DRY7_9FUNG|nr:hypothetical protein ATC70_010144 [Mucor velutinosus]